MKPLAYIRRTTDLIAAVAGGWRADVVLKTDGAGWILDQFSRQLKEALQGRLKVQVSPMVAGFRRRRCVVHFVGGECFHDPNWQSRRSLSKAMIGIWWHGSDQSPEPAIQDAARRIEPVSRQLARVHVTCAISRQVVCRMGVPADRVALLPLGVNLTLFHPPRNQSERMRARARLGCPADAMVIGSFQKDGCGWGEGETPKRIKGPDVFVKVVTRLAERHRVFALIPGPARGYLKRELEAAGVPFWNDGFMPFTSLPAYYHACDMYLMTGREEGGPAAVLEAPACGVPFVGHRAGMAPDVLTDGRTAFLSDVDDIDDLALKAERVLTSQALRDRLANAAFDAIRPYGWPEIAKQYLQLYAAIAPN